jgi:translocation and assembly module TamB
MAQEGAITAEADAGAAPRRPVGLTIGKWIAIVVGGLLLLVAAIVFGLNTQPGRRFIANQVSGYQLANGVSFKVGRIDGSLYGAMVLRDVRITDQKGVFATSPQMNVDWRPFAFARSHVDVRSFTSPLVRVGRLPVLKPVPTDPNEPWLPDIDIDVNRLAIERIDLAPPVSGARRIARLVGTVHIADRRAQIVANGGTIAAPGVAGGDRFALKLDAVPDDDRFDVDLKLNAPRNGMVAGLAGFKAPLAASIDGRGSWSVWNGRASSPTWRSRRVTAPSRCAARRSRGCIWKVRSSG